MPSLGEIILNTAAKRRGEIDAEPVRQLQQMGVLQGILAQQQRMQQSQQDRAEMAQLKGVVAQAGGVPATAIKALLASGNPKAIELAAKLHSLMPKQEKPDKPELVEIEGPDGRPIKRWVMPGQSTGVDVGTAYKTPRADKGEWSDPYNLGGAMVQKNSVTGEIRTAVSRPSAGVTVNMPATSDLMQKPDGSYVRVRIGKNGAVEEVPLGNVRPPQTPAERKAGADAAGVDASIESVRDRIGKMTALIQKGGVTGSVVGPLGAAGRIAETAIGAVQPGAATPSLDYDNEKALLLADVRKVVEKDPNLSNQERQTLYQTLGGGIMQTPGSAMRTLNNVMNYVESKRRAGGKAAPTQPGAAVQPPENREVGKVYDTPRGKMKWTGTGWLPEN